MRSPAPNPCSKNVAVGLWQFARIISDAIAPRRLPLEFLCNQKQGFSQPRIIARLCHLTKVLGGFTQFL
jgi:hypothetical protein